MKTLPLLNAVLIYGSNRYPVVRSALVPLPDFDFDDIECCLFRALAVMSNQSGGHPMNEPRLSVYVGETYVTVSGNGYSLAWGVPPEPPKDQTSANVQEWAMQFIDTVAVTNYPWGVVTDQYGEGWIRAKQTFPKQQPSEQAPSLRWRK